MKKLFWNFSIILFTTILISSCSAKKNRFPNRAFHSVTTKYNVLYNGQVAYDQAKKQIDDNYNDNFWELLPIEPLKIEEDKLDIPLPGQKKDSATEKAQGFDKAELKAVKAIQKHSMDIDGRERNRQIDDAYLLLGKTRYYSQRFVPALEAFNFILGTYTDPLMRDKTRIWQAKTLIRLENQELALQTLNILLKNDRLPLELVENAYIANAMAYTTLDSTHLVIKNLDSAVLYSANPKQKARNLFILGQLHRKKNRIDSSNLAFEQLINFKKAPYRYKIHAEIERAKNFSAENDSTELMLNNLEVLIEERDNRPYLDELYYQKGIIEAKNDSIALAIESFNNSLRAKNAKPFQKELTYEQLGNIYFDKANFKLAGSYYDSVIQSTKTKNSKRVRRLTRKRKSLDDVIYYEGIAQNNDSIIDLASMSEDDRKKYFEDYVEKLKKQDEEAREKQEILARTSGFGVASTKTTKNSSGGTFYFYNVNAVGFGEQEFKRIWGNRPLEDNWRLSDKNDALANQIDDDTDAQNEITDSKRYDVEEYLKTIPKGEKTIDSLKSERNEAYYQLGLIYKEQFKEYQLAADRLEKLLTFPPKENLVLPIKYHLYKIYENLDASKRNKMEDDIVNNYPDSKYATIIKNPDEVLSSSYEEITPEKVYEDIYCSYDYEHYEEALEATNKALKQFEDLPIIPKLELLKAYILVKIKGQDAFKNALDFVALNYPNTKEGKHATEILGSLKETTKTETK